MKKIGKIICILFIIALIGGCGIILIKKLNNEESVTISGDKITNNEKNETYNVSKENEISKYLPKDITKIAITNNLSDENNPSTINVEGIEKIEEFINLFFKTSWTEINEKQLSSNFDGAFYQITITGDTETIINMQGYGGNNTAFGIVKIGDKHYYIDRNIYQEMANYTVEKYYLHDSDLKLPEQEKCYEAQQKALEGIQKEEKEKLQKNIREIHTMLEYYLLDAVMLIKDSNSPYWESFTNYGVFTEPFTGTKVDNGGRFRYILDELAKIKDISKNEQVKKDLQNAYDILKEGMDEHNLEKCFETHKIIHDYDYFVINTPVHLETEPADWGGVKNYFGKANII